MQASPFTLNAAGSLFPPPFSLPLNPSSTVSPGWIVPFHGRLFAVTAAPSCCHHASWPLRRVCFSANSNPSSHAVYGASPVFVIVRSAENAFFESPSSV